MAIGTRSIVASVDGAMWVFFRHSMNIFMMRATSQVSSLIRRSCGHMPRQLEDKKHRHSDELEAYDETESLSQMPVSVAFYFDSQAPALIGNHRRKAYDSDAFIAASQMRYPASHYDKELYKRRNLIERFFGWLKQDRSSDSSKQY